MTTQGKATRMIVGDVGTCPRTGKKMLLTRAAAKRQKRMLGDRSLHVFRCTHCDHFHLGHQYGQPRAYHRDLHNHHQHEEVTPMHTTTPPGGARERCGSCGGFITADGYCRCS